MRAGPRTAFRVLMAHVLSSYCVYIGLTIAGCVIHPTHQAVLWSRTKLLEFAAAPVLVPCTMFLHVARSLVPYDRPPLLRMLAETWGTIGGYAVAWIASYKLLGRLARTSHAGLTVALGRHHRPVQHRRHYRGHGTLEFTAKGLALNAIRTEPVLGLAILVWLVIQLAMMLAWSAPVWEFVCMLAVPSPLLLVLLWLILRYTVGRKRVRLLLDPAACTAHYVKGQHFVLIRTPEEECIDMAASAADEPGLLEGLKRCFGERFFTRESLETPGPAVPSRLPGVLGRTLLYGVVILAFALGVVVALVEDRRAGRAGASGGAVTRDVTEAQRAFSSGTTSSPSTTPAARPVRLIVATYNIKFGITDSRLLAAVVSNIRGSGADIVAIQEGNEVMAAHLRTELASEYPHIRYWPGPRACGSGWLSKMPLLNEQVLPKPPQAGFDTRAAQVEVAGRQVQLVNVHLRSSVPRADAGAKEFLNLWKKTEGVRRREIEAICSALPTALPVVLAGDFNSTSSMAATTFLRERGFIDSFASVTGDAESHPTFHWGPGRGALKVRVDYIWHSAGVRTLSSRIVRSGPSDHYLLVSELELSAASTQPSRPTTGTAK